MALQRRIEALWSAKVRQTAKRFRKKRGFVSQNSGTVSRCNAEYGAAKGCKWCQNCQKTAENRQKTGTFSQAGAHSDTNDTP
jgi:hypothetical protein